MLEYAWRRLLWAIPTLLGISLVAFAVTSLIPQPAELKLARSIAIATGEFDQLEELDTLFRGRFFDLPPFFNRRPTDTESHVERVLSVVGANRKRSDYALHRLARIGGAAFPYLMPALANAPDEARMRVASALHPVGERMELPSLPAADDPRSASFWADFWEEHSLDFTEPAAKRAVMRLERYGGDQREQVVQSLDTFALPYVIEAMHTTRSPEARMRLTRVANHATGLDATVSATATNEQWKRALAAWDEWWFGHESDYVTLSGFERLGATVLQTRYGKWMQRLCTGRFGVSVRDGLPIGERLKECSRVTLTIIFSTLLGSLTVALPLGAILAWQQHRRVVSVAHAMLMALYSLPPFLTAILLERYLISLPTAPGGRFALALSVLALSATSFAALARQQRVAMIDTSRQDYIRTARSKGVPEWRVLIVHALRNAAAPTMAMAMLQVPALLGAALVIEEIFNLHGLGYELLRAVEVKDTEWLIATVFVAAMLSIAALIVSDLLHALLDPRVRERLISREEVHS